MPSNVRTVQPRNFFLNEQHELAPGEKEGGGRVTEYVGINWAAKGGRINQSLLKVRDFVGRSRDPLRGARYFILARPTAGLERKSVAKGVTGGKLAVQIDYAEDESRVFGRLGMDLVQVNEDGSATVHALPERFEQLVRSSQALEEFGSRERARWATLESFEPIPPALVVDDAWLRELKPVGLVDAVIELQPLLTTLEVDQVTRAVAEMLRRGREGELRGIGSDFSGRQWLRAKLLRESLLELAKTFFSIQTIHPPLYAVFLATPRGPRTPATGTLRPPAPTVPPDLPCVAVVDTGVPADHLHLARFCRGRYIAPTSPTGAHAGSHGSMVASRVVFGDLDCSAGIPSRPTGECSFYDVNIALDNKKTDEKGVMPALQAIVAVAPDIRVFNLSFDNVRPLDAELPNVRREKLKLVQDLDNFIFANDILVVAAAGNSEVGVRPAKAYPNHVDDPQWALGTWPRSFNALTCGSFIEHLHPDGVANEPGAPSPFTRVGWGLCDSPKPDLSEHGGNGNAAYHFQPGLGVWGCTASGEWEDWCGTSFAAPLLARRAAIVLRRLQQFCEPGTRPFGATAKAYLALSAIQRSLSSGLLSLAERTLGKGRADEGALQTPRADRAMFMWQGLLGAPGELARVQLPVPREWLKGANAPHLHLVLAWDPPVNAAVEHLWASRKVSCQLRVRLETKAMVGSKGGHKTYPLLDRTYDLRRLPEGIEPADDLWLLEFSYEQAAEYYPGQIFNPQQRIALAAELYDESENPLSPQAFLQALPVAASMTRFSTNVNLVRTPVMVKTPI